MRSIRRGVTNVVVLLAAVAGVLALSIADASRSQRRLLDDFTAAQKEEGHAAADALAARVDALDRDARMLGDPVERSRADRGLDPATEQRVLSSAFQALANVVGPYRSIALHGGDETRDGARDVVSVDPAEDAATAEALVADSRRFAASLAGGAAAAYDAPVSRHGDRAFLLYGAKVGPRGEYGVLVIASDIARLLAPAAAQRGATSAQLFVVDPTGETWGDCGAPRGCRTMTAAEIPAAARGQPLGVSRVHEGAPRGMGRADAPAVRVVERIARPSGAWTVTWFASTAPLVALEDSLVLRLLLTALAVAAAVLGVGVAILRQQRSALTLEERLQLAEALAAARETSEAIVENAPLGILGVTRDGKVALANRFLDERVGPIKVGAPLAEAFPASSAEWAKDLLPPLLGPVDVAPAPRASVRSLRRASGAGPVFDVRIVPVGKRPGGIQTFALFEDRSAIRDLENQLVRAEKLITVGVLSAGIAHEIGTPLAVIRGRAEQVLRTAAPGSDAERDLRVLIKHIDRIASTIRQLLDFSRRQSIERSAVPLDAAVERTRDLLQWKLESRGLRLETELDPGIPPLAADGDQLQQVLVNLLMNACDASPLGGTIRFVARAAPAAAGSGDGDQALVSMQVIDAGHGIAPENVHAIFDPFFTTKKRGEGTGLGLTIVSSIVGNHGGKIDVASAHGQGTTVTVLWPAHSEARRA